ncbi:MAG: Type 1 glutamine amidotransferase-like domain-containing protein [Patescibacteria group bacterium]|jgi:dipeptidase E
MTNTRNKENKLFLSGGGGADDSKILDKAFVSLLGNGKMLYIPIAMPGGTISYESCYDWITSTMSGVSDDFVEIDMCTDLKKLNFDMVKKYRAIYVGGGNTYKLLQDIEESGVKDSLLSAINSGVIYYGGSAGAIIAGKSIATVAEENDNEYKFEEGLSMLGEYSVLCHYDGTQDEKIKKYIELNGHPVVAMPERSGLIVSGQKAVVAGLEGCFIFNKEEKKGIDVGTEIIF